MALALFIAAKARPYASQRELAIEIGCSRGAVRNAMAALTKSGLLSPEGSSRTALSPNNKNTITVSQPSKPVATSSLAAVRTQLAKPNSVAIQISQPGPSESGHFHPDAYQVVAAYRLVKADKLAGGFWYERAMEAVSAVLADGASAEELIAAGAAHARAHEGEERKYRKQCSDFYGSGAWLDYKPRQIEVRRNESWDDLAVAFARKRT